MIKIDRQFLVDINPNAELPKYELVLCKLNEEPLQVLKNITDFEIRPYFADIDEISFKVPLYRTQNDGTNVKNELYDIVDGNMLVLLNEMKYFMLIKPKAVSNKKTGEAYKEILGYSREYEFTKKQIVGYEAMSRKIYDINNVKDENGLEIGFLNYIERRTSWRVGYVNVDLMLKYRGLNFPKVNMLQSFQEVQKTFGCLFQFDTINKIINVYEITQLGKNQGLHISDRNFINKISQEINDDEIVTRLTLYGRDNISIQRLNITGQPWIQNLDFFKKTKYMSQDLIDALDAYDSYVTTKENIFTGYLNQVDNLNEILSTKKIELAELITQLRVIEANLDVAISSNQSTSTFKQQQSAKIQEINNKQLEIDSVTSQINSIQANIKSLGNDLSMNNHFTEAQLRELDPFIREDDYSDSNYTEENLEELLVEGKKILSQISYPKVQIPIDVEDFLSLVEGQHFRDKFVLGDLISITDKDLGIDLELRLVGYTHNPDNKKLSLVFSNRESVDDANIYLKELIENINTTTGTVNFNRFKWDKAEQADFIINQYVNENLNLAKQQIMKADGQQPMIDERGIWLVKENPDGSIDPAQLRLVNNAIVMTNDNWNGLEWALTAEKGINANLINGKLGQFAQVYANQIIVGPDGELLPDEVLGEGLVKQNYDYNGVIITSQEGFEVYNNLNQQVIQIGGIDVTGDGIKDKYGVKVNHNDDSFTAIVGDGFYRVVVDGNTQERKEYFFEREVKIVGDYTQKSYDGTIGEATIKNDMNVLHTIQLPSHMIGKNFKILSDVYMGDGEYMNKFADAFRYSPVASVVKTKVEIQSMSGQVWDGYAQSTMPASIKNTGQFRILAYYYYIYSEGVFPNRKTYTVAFSIKAKVDVIA